MTAAAIVWLLFEVSWRSVLVAALVGGVLLLWRVKGGAARHAAWTAVMVVMLLMPALLAVVPEVPVPTPAFRRASQVSPERSTAEPVPQPGSEARPERLRGSSPEAVQEPAVSVSSSSSSAMEGTRFQLAVGIWLAGIAVNLVVMFVGWRLARRLMATARVSEVDPRVMESSLVAAPCAVGLWRVHVLVPQAWRTWPRAGRDAVLQHEFAHVYRRDLFVLFVARVNRALFWFHPLAWWLERRVAAAAEQACDEAVLQSGQDPQRYASVLLEFATALRGSGGRVAWQSLGMAEGTDLESRITRVLTGEVPRMSRGRIAGVITMSAAATIVAVACSQAPPALALNPEITARMARDVESRTAGAEARSMTPEEVRTLTDQVIANPDDSALVEKLRRYYSAQRDIRPGTPFTPSPEFLESHRRLVSWAIEHRPGSGLAEWQLPRSADAEGFDAAKALWARHLASNSVSFGSYDQAIRFTSIFDPGVAERLALNAHSRFPRMVKPNGELGASSETYWLRQLGAIYAAVINGTHHDPSPFARLSPSPSGSAEAERVKALLESSRDPVLLAEVGGGLTGNESRLGLTYLRRSLQLDPDQPRLRDVVDRRLWQELLGSQRERVRAVAGVELDQLAPEQALALPEDLQWTTLPYLAERAYATAMSRGFQNTDDAVWREYLRRARVYSDRAIALVEGRIDSQAPRVRYQAHVVRGFAAIAENDRRLAVTHLESAVAALTEKPTTLMDGRGPLVTLTNYLIKAGDIAAVTNAFDRLSQIGGARYPEFRESAADLRAGRMPDQYQRMVARPKDPI